MRSIKELLIILKERIIQSYPYAFGLCYHAKSLLNMMLITKLEYLILKNWIDGNKPKFLSTFWSFNPFKQKGYYWRANNRNIRIKFLIHHINKLENDNKK